MSHHDKEIPIQILGHEWQLQPRYGFGLVLQRTLPNVLRNVQQRGGSFKLGPGEGKDGGTKPEPAKDYGIRILLQVLTAGPCCAAWPTSSSGLDFIEELHSECSASVPPQALEFQLTESAPGLSLYLYPESAYTGNGGGEQSKPYPVFLGFIVADGALELAHDCIQSARLPLVLDLDETVVKAYSATKLTKEIDNLTASLAGCDAWDRQQTQHNINLLKVDRELVQQFCRHGCVTIGGETIRPRYEDICPEPGKGTVKRPVIKVPGRILTRIDPHKMETTMIMHIRPGWTDLRDFIRGDPDGNGGWRPPFNVYVCTAADREYALEVWRLLDPEAQLIPFGLRGTHFKAGMHKKDISSVLSLPADPGMLNALRTAMPLAVVLDDRLDIWGDHSKPHILQVSAFSPNSQAAAAKSATVHDPVHYNKAAEELRAIVESLKSIHRGLFDEVNVKLKAELAAAQPSLLTDIEKGRVPETRTCPCVRNHFAWWKQRQKEQRQAKAARKQPGQQPDLVSELTGAQSLSRSRRQDLGEAQQNGDLQHLEQEAQSARTPEGHENGGELLDTARGIQGLGKGPAVHNSPGGNAREARSNGGTGQATKASVGPALQQAEELAPRTSGMSSLHLGGGGAETDASLPGNSRAVGPPGLPKRLRARPKDMPGAAPSSRNASRGGQTSAAAAQGRALPGHGPAWEALHSSRAAAAAQEPQPIRPARAAPPSEHQPPAAALGAARASADPPLIQDVDTGTQPKSMKEEPPDKQAPAEASEEMPKAGASDSDIEVLVDDNAEPASASSAASEPASAPGPAPDRMGGAHEQEEASPRTDPPSKRRKAAPEDIGPSSKRHGVGSMRDPSGRWRWRVAATDEGPEQTFALDEEDAAAEAADKIALLSAVDGNVLPQLNIPLSKHVVSGDPLLREAARDVLKHLQPKILPRAVQAKLREAARAVTEDAKSAGKQSKSSGSPAKRKRRQNSAAS